ncbi:MAG TPA: PHB depolymerase family esterase [Polyangia bacterium]
MLRRVVLALFVAAGCGASHGKGGGGGGGAGGGGGSQGGGADGGAPMGLYINATFSNDQGARDYRAYIPSGYVAGTPVPLVVFLHGCGESLDHAEAATRLTALAEARTFVALYPAQSSAANPSTCWNFFLAADQARDKGEPSILAGITRKIMTDWSIDTRRVFVVGVSAGGGMSVVMGATYPDLYAALGVVAGCEFNGLPCGSSGGPDPQMAGQSAYQAMGGNARFVPVIVFHGDVDTVAPPINGQQVTDQWVATDDWADDGAHDGSFAATASAHDSGQVSGGETWDRDRYVRSDGTVGVEHWIVHGMGHAWPGGDAAFVFTDAKAPDATTIAYDFFLAHPQ